MLKTLQIRRSPSKVWLGVKLNRDKIWVDIKGSPLSFTNWIFVNGLKESSMREMCPVLLNNGSWVLEHCEENLPYVCQKVIPRHNSRVEWTIGNEDKEYSEVRSFSQKGLDWIEANFTCSEVSAVRTVKAV